MGIPHILQERALRYFMAVIGSGSINKAAAKLNVAPSAISRQIARLEIELGAQLFERRTWGMPPSEAGELLAAHVRRTELDAARVAGEIMAVETLQRGTVRLASVEGLAIALLPHLVLEFRQRFSGIQFDLRITTPEDVTRCIRDGEADIGLTFGLAAHRDIKVARRLNAPVHAIMPADHPLAKRKQIALADLQPYPIALPSPDTSIRRLYDLSCSRQGIVIRPVFTSNYASVLINFAIAGGGIALFGELAMRHRTDSDRFVAIPLTDRELTSRHLEVHILADRILPKSVETFLDMFSLRFDELPGGMVGP